MFSFILYLSGMILVGFAQEPCSQRDPGEWAPVRPVLYPQIYEATEQELLLYPDDSMFQSELRLHGVIDQSSPNGMILEPQGDFLIVNPAEVFKFETVSGKNIIRLIKPLDRDGPTESYDDDVDVISFTLKCSPASNLSIEVYYDVSVLILDKNDNPPMFINAPYETTINELAPIGSRVLTVTAVDKDSNLDGNITYSIVTNLGILNDGSELFEIDSLHGILTTKGNLDYEKLGDGHKYYVVRVIVMDGGPNTKRSAYTDVRIQVTDGNDHGPSFIYPGCLQHKMACLWPKYTTDINAIMMNEELRFRGVPDLSGNDVDIQAMDMDAVPSDITFSIASTYPSGFDSYFTVETVKSGEYFRAIVKQVKPINMNQLNMFEIFLKAEELSPEKRYEVAMVLFVGKVQSEDSDPSTTQAPETNTDAQNGGKTVNSDKADEFTQTTVALIVVIAVTLTLVLCLVVAMACLTLRRRSYPSDKTPLTTVTRGHENNAYTAQL